MMMNAGNLPAVVLISRPDADRILRSPRWAWVDRMDDTRTQRRATVTDGIGSDRCWKVDDFLRESCR